MDDVESSEEEEEEDEKVGELFCKGMVKAGAEPLQSTSWPIRNIWGEAPAGCLQLLPPPLMYFHRSCW